MAKTLQKVIQERLSQKPDQTALGQGANINKLLQAKQGKAVGSSGPAASSLAESQAVAQTGQQLEEVQQRGQIIGIQQQQTSEAQEQSADIQAKQLELKKEGIREQALQKKSDLAADFVRSNKELDFKKAAASAEQLGFLSRLSNDKYVEELQREGAKSRLNNDLYFKEALQKTMIEDSQAFQQSGLDLKGLLNMDRREFEKEMAQMDAATAIQMMEQSIRAEAEIAKYGSIGNVLTTGIQAYDEMEKDQK